MSSRIDEIKGLSPWPRAIPLSAVRPGRWVPQQRRLCQAAATALRAWQSAFPTVPRYLMHGQLLSSQVRIRRRRSACCRPASSAGRRLAITTRWARCRASWIGCSTKMRDTPPRLCLHPRALLPARARTLARDRRGSSPALCPYRLEPPHHRRVLRGERPARLLDERGLIAHPADLRSRISFNIGPTLLSGWKSRHRASIQAILAADAESQRRFFLGMARRWPRSTNTSSMPLASRRDRVTQVRWGLRDFKRRFGSRSRRHVPRTAVDLRTLSVLAEHDIRYTVLAPHQAKPPPGESLDPTRPYRVALPVGARSLCSSTTDRCRGPWRLPCSAVAKRFLATAQRVSRVKADRVRPS